MKIYRVHFTTQSGREDDVQYIAGTFREARKMYEEDFGTLAGVDYIELIDEGTTQRYKVRPLVMLEA